jgi:threonine aldolase
MARRLETQLRAVQMESPLVLKILYPVQANSIFASFHPNVLEGLRQRGWEIYTFIGDSARLMCSWETNETDIDHFIADVKSLVSDQLTQQRVSAP